MSQSAVELPTARRRHRAAADPRSAACALGLVSILLLGFSEGGYYEETWRWALLALLAVTGIRLALATTLGLGRLDWLALAGLGCLSGWMLVSASWGIAGTEASREAERCALYVAALAALVLVTRRESSKALLVSTLVGIVALSGYALGERLVRPPALDPFQGALLTGPVAYANALGILAAIGALLGVGLLREANRQTRGVLLAGAASICAIALALTSSRGAWLAALVGLAVLAACRLEMRRVVAAGAPVATVLVVLIAVNGVSLGDRPAYWSVAIADASERPLLGSGAGSFDDYWLEHRPIPAYVRDAHSLYLETLAELGVVGFALLICALLAPLVAAARCRGHALVGPAAAAYAAFLVHAGLDWDWEMPVTVLAGLSCGAALLASARGLSRS